ncbi:MAG: glutaminyl-peptide cyclotransferase [Candidatus Omnitrophica bacterium]|nr:glutaminyl-peptide cyclotransferase [Candidatus Omnitrophota bacterium]
MRLWRLFFSLSIIFLCASFSSLGWADTPESSYKIVNAYPHDPNAFTEGLVFENGYLFESTGIKGRSTLRRVALENGKITLLRKLEDIYFAEGIAIYGDKIIQLTYQSHLGFVYDKKTFRPLRRFSYPTQGWGLTYDGSQLIMSDGTAKLYYLDPENFMVLREIEVSDERGPVRGLNELEYIKGEIFANIYPTERIARINPQSAKVTSWINLTGILKDEKSPAPGCSLNGIAYDTEKNRIFVTGKYYPKVFEIELIQ